MRTNGNGSKRIRGRVTAILIGLGALVAASGSVGCDDYGLGGYDYGMYDPYGYWTDAMLDANAYSWDVFESANDAWSDYIRM